MTRPPGQLVDVGTHRLHLRCLGSGAPAVVFDAALGGSSLSWGLVQPDVARVTTACAYDRAGFGWSEAGPLPRTAGRIADELHALLAAAAIPPPVVLVGHSFGGLVVQLFAVRHRPDVAGMVLIEPAIAEEWAHPAAASRAQMERGVRLCRYGARAARHGLARVVAGLVSIGALGLARATVRIVSRGGLGREDEGVLAPIWKLPPESRAVLKQMWAQPKFFEALGSQIESICESAADVLRALAERPLDVPLTVVTAATADPRRLRADRMLAESVAHGRHVVAADSGHWVPLDAPHVVAGEIVAMVRQVRACRDAPCRP